MLIMLWKVKHWRRLMKKWTWDYHEFRFKGFKTVEESGITANRVLGSIYITFIYRSSDILMPLYNSLARLEKINCYAELHKGNFRVR